MTRVAASANVDRLSSCSFWERECSEDPVRLVEEAWELVRGQRGARDVDDDGLSSHVQDDNPEDPAGFELDGVRATGLSEGQEDVAFTDDLAVELVAVEPGEPRACRRLVGGLVSR